MDQTTEPKQKSKGIRMDDLEAGEMLASIARHYRWTEGATNAFLIRQEYGRLFSNPRSDVSLCNAADLDVRALVADGRVIEVIDPS